MRLAIKLIEKEKNNFIIKKDHQIKSFYFYIFSRFINFSFIIFGQEISLNTITSFLI